MNFWVGETKTEPSEGTVACYHGSYTCMYLPQRNPKVEEDTVECSTDLYR